MNMFKIKKLNAPSILVITHLLNKDDQKLSALHT